MPFKFTLLGLELSKNSPAYKNTNIERESKMVKRKNTIPKMAKRKLTSQQRKFSKKQITQQGKFKKAVQFCHSSTKSKEAFGKCLSKKLTKKTSKKK